MTHVLVLNGPNLNLLGEREPAVYGDESLDDIMSGLSAVAGSLGVTIEARQSNHEGQLIDWMQEARDRVAGIILNPGALTHYSIALRDAVASISVPVVEVHLSNIHAREPWRKTSVISEVSLGVVAGFGAASYEIGLRGLIARLAS